MIKFGLPYTGSLSFCFFALDLSAREALVYYVTRGEWQRFRKSVKLDITRVEIVAFLRVACIIFNNYTLLKIRHYDACRVVKYPRVQCSIEFVNYVNNSLLILNVGSFFVIYPLKKS